MKQIFIRPDDVLLDVIMVDRDNEEGPLFVWTFPMITRLQNRSGILSFGAGASTVKRSVEDKVSEVRETTPVRDRLSGEEEDEEDDDISELESQLQAVGESSESIFSQDDEQDYGQASLSNNLIEMDENAFVPVRINVEQGEEVTWENNDDTTHRVVSSEGEEFSSEQLEPGETYSHTFRSEGVTRYFDSIQGEGQMCGAVIVGDAELTEPLPCDTEGTPELFSDSSDEADTTSRRSMSAAVEEKEDMDMGF